MTEVFLVNARRIVPASFTSFKSQINMRKWPHFIGGSRVRAFLKNISFQSAAKSPQEKLGFNILNNIAFFIR